MKNQKFTNREQIAAWLLEMNIVNFHINADLEVLVAGDVELSNKGLKFLPVNFKKVYGNFNVIKNSLKTMEGFPEFVAGNCLAHHNKITSTNFCPMTVLGIFGLINNKIKSFDALPTHVGGDMKLNGNPLPIDQRTENNLQTLKNMAIADVELALYNEHTAEVATQERDLFAEFLNSTPLPTAKKYKL